MDASEAIRSRLARYCHTVDAGQFDELGMCFTADAVVAVMGQRIEGRAAIEAWMTAAMPPHRRGKHVNINVAIDQAVEGRASAVSDFLFMAQADGRWQVTQVGQYVDTLVDDGDAWRIAHRQIHLGPSGD